MTFRIIPSGDTALVVEFGDQISRDLSHKVLSSKASLQTTDIVGVVEIVPTFRSLLVHYDPLATTSEELSEQLLPILEAGVDYHARARLWHLPVCYEGDYAPDIDDVAQRTDLTSQDVAELHCQNTYYIYMVGFLPGYPYMGDVPEILRLPRRTTPRLRVPPGSVAIATAMTAIYPLESPGGWHLIGTTPIGMFDEKASRPALFTAGDQVVFSAVSEKEYLEIEAEIATGTYKLLCEEVQA